MTSLLALLQMLPIIGNVVISFVNKYYDSKVQMTMSQLQCDRDKAIAYLQTLAQVDANRINFLQAVAHSPVLLLIVGGFAFPFIVYINKVVVWDICLGLGSTMPIKDANTIEWGRAILYGIFGVSGTLGAASVIKAGLFNSKA